MRAFILGFCLLGGVYSQAKLSCDSVFYSHVMTPVYVERNAFKFVEPFRGGAAINELAFRVKQKLGLQLVLAAEQIGHQDDTITENPRNLMVWWPDLVLDLVERIGVEYVLDMLIQDMRAEMR